MIVEVKLLESVKEMIKNNPGGGFSFRTYKRI